MAFIFIFGLSSFVLFVVLSFFLGIVLLAIFWKNMLEFQLLALRELFANFSYVIAAFLLMVPGVLSSFLAICILIFALVFRRKKVVKNRYEDTEYEEEIIDVEIVEDKKR